MKTLVSCIFLGALLVFNALFAQDTPSLVIHPAQPRAGDQVTVTLDNSQLTDTGQLYLNFTYSNYYELPTRIALKSTAEGRQASFVIPTYGKYASFIISDAGGRRVLQPTDTTHYEIFVYDAEGELAEGNYLAKAYSLGVQNRTSPYRVAQQQEFFQKELAHFPQNYEANLQILAFEMKSQNPETRQEAKARALDIIQSKYEESPTESGNLNQVTKGYLIIGENQRVDSIRQVVIRDYPETHLGVSYRLYRILDMEEDSSAVLDSLEALMRVRNAENEAAFGLAYDYLFKHYARQKDAQNAAMYLEKLTTPGDSPYQWRSFAENVDILLENEVLLEKALELNQRIMNNIDAYPVTLVRYFPETGYLIAHDEEKDRKTDLVHKERMAKHALLYGKMGDKAQALAWLEKSYLDLQQKELLLDAGKLFTSLGEREKARSLYEKAYVQYPFDQEIRTLITASLSKEDADPESYFSALDTKWKQAMFTELSQRSLSLDFPSEFHITNMGKDPFTADSLRGKVWVIDLWATWCIPCLESFPYVQQIYDRHKSNSDVGFMLLNTGSGNSFEDALQWATENTQYDFPVYYSYERQFITDLGVTSIPTTFLVDKTGKIRFKKVGNNGEHMLKELEGMIEYLLLEKASDGASVSGIF